MNFNRLVTITGIVIFLSVTSLYWYQSMHAVMMKGHLSQEWYAQEMVALKKQVNTLLDRGSLLKSNTESADDLYAIVVPHAAYQYSGLAAAAGYAQARKKKNIRKVVIIAPCHTVDFEGLLMPHFDAYQTPLGKVIVDTHAVSIMNRVQNSFCMVDAYKNEHAFEIQLPFIQTIAPHAMILPLLIGRLSQDSIRQFVSCLDEIVDDQTLIVVTTDFVHYGSAFQFTPFAKDIHEELIGLDGAYFRSFMSGSLMHLQNTFNQQRATVCGINGLALFLALLRKKGIENNMHLLAYYSSPIADQLPQAHDEDLFSVMSQRLPDSAFEHSVSYGTIACYKKQEESLVHPTSFEARTALALARQSIANKLGKEKASTLQTHVPFFDQRIGAFVTLNNEQGELRGCIGNIVTDAPLQQTIVRMASAAAFEDSRFSAVTEEELPNLHISISLLSKPKDVASIDEIELGTHGVILHWKDPSNGTERSSVFLPEVASDQGWSRQTMLEHLSRKAGCESDAWKEATFQVFTTLKIEE